MSLWQPRTRIVLESLAAGLDDPESSEEFPDFSYLGHIPTLTAHPSLPRRGEKDFEGHGTTSQDRALANSRDAMHDALSYHRIHSPKYHLVARFIAETGWAVVDAPKGQHFRTLGKADAYGSLHLLPEETLYLVERGDLDLLRTDGNEGSLGGASHSLQSAYTMLIGKLGLTLERYTVYAGLKRSGYVVQRSSMWEPATRRDELLQMPQTNGSNSHGSAISSTLTGLSWAFASVKLASLLPQRSLIGLGLYRNYVDIYRHLYLIPFHDPSRTARITNSTITHPRLPRATKDIHGKSTDELDSNTVLINCTFDVWKPRSDFKKSAAGPPNFRIAVVDVRQQVLSVLEELDHLFRTVPPDPPSPSLGTQLHSKLKYGWKNVIVAVVDQGVISYLRIADAGFGKEKLYEKVVRGKKGNKPHGGRGGKPRAQPMRPRSQ